MALNTPRHYDVIVLGAGMSGLACASRLYQNDRFQKKNSIIVLEARDRIGGRIESVNVNGCRLDTGANWIHGTGTKERPNPLMGIFPEKRFRELEGGVSFRAPDDKKTEEGKADCVKVDSSSGKSEGDLVIPAEFSGPLQEARWGTIGALHEVAASISAEKARDTSMLSALQNLESFRESFDRLPEKFHNTLRGFPQFLEVMEAAPLSDSSAETPLGRPGMSLAEFAIDDFDGDQVFLQDGYTPVVKEVAKELLDAGLVQLNIEITRIHWDRKPLLLETTSADVSFTADQVICTLPLGVLQHNNIFEPLLPQTKQQAIFSLGYGTLDKIFLVYDRPWWETDEPFRSIIAKGSHSTPDSISGFTSDLPGISISPTSTSSGPRLLTLLNLQALTGYPVLSAFVSCTNAVEQIEKHSDAEATSLLQNALTSWFGAEPPKPEAVHVTRWNHDVYSRGSYSHVITGISEHRHREEFATPVKGNGDGMLRFAGEHTSREHFATVHGALLSGWREADAILDEMPLDFLV